MKNNFYVLTMALLCCVVSSITNFSLYSMARTRVRVEVIYTLQTLNLAHYQELMSYQQTLRIFVKIRNRQHMLFDHKEHYWVKILKFSALSGKLVRKVLITQSNYQSQLNAEIQRNEDATLAALDGSASSLYGSQRAYVSAYKAAPVGPRPPAQMHQPFFVHSADHELTKASVSTYSGAQHQAQAAAVAPPPARLVPDTPVGLPGHSKDPIPLPSVYPYAYGYFSKNWQMADTSTGPSAADRAEKTHKNSAFTDKTTEECLEPEVQASWLTWGNLGLAGCFVLTYYFVKLCLAKDQAQQGSASHSKRL